MRMKKKNRKIKTSKVLDAKSLYVQYEKIIERIMLLEEKLSQLKNYFATSDIKSANGVILVTLLLILNIFHTLF